MLQFENVTLTFSERIPSIVTREALDALDQQLTSEQAFADPYPLYDRLRAADPVHLSEVLNGWVLTGYTDVSHVLRDHERFSNVGRISLFTEQLPAVARTRIGPLIDHFSRAILHVDPPAHTHLRSALQQVFTKPRIQGMRRRVQQLSDQLLDRTSANGKMDIIADFAYPLAITVLGELLGLPASDYDLYKKWSDDIGVRLFGTGKATVENVDNARTSLIELSSHLSRLIDERRRSPRDDIISGLTGVRDFSDDELISTCITLVLAGHGTTMNLIGNGMHALLRHPDQMQRLRRDPSLIITAIEEILRYDNPLQRIWRMVKVDVKLRGKLIRRGEIVFPTMGAANRDTAEFPNPHRLDISRRPNRHVSFGAGSHLCVGAALARLQGEIAINRILQRFRQLEPATGTLNWDRNLFHRGLMALPVTFEPG